MTNAEYKKLILEEPEDIELAAENVKKWLDDIVSYVKRSKNIYYDLCWGHLDTDAGEYENNIRACEPRADCVHIFDGIDKLAEILGYELKKEINNKDNYGVYEYTYYFEYKGLKIFQLEEKEL